MATPNTGIPYVPENTQDPAAGLNLSLNVIDALLQTAVINMDQTAPPGAPADGNLHIVAVGGTGAWAGQDNNLARYVADGAFWQFYTAGTQVRLVLNLDDGGLYRYIGGWEPLTPVLTIVDAADDAAAATAGVPVGGRYRNGSVLMIRVA